MSDFSKIMVFSGSPIPDSNTDRLVQHIARSSGESFEFVKLSNYHIGPCRACKRCVKTNVCVETDEFQLFADKIKQADAIILGSYTPYCVMDAFTKALLERFYSMRHINSQLKNKFLISAVTSTYADARFPAQRAMVVESVVEKMRHVGMVDIDGSNPCISCGAGNDCENSIKRRMGSDVDLDLSQIIPIEDQPAWNEAERMGEKLGRLIRGEEQYEANALANEINAQIKARIAAKKAQLQVQ